MPSHAEKRIVPYAPHQLFDLVVDVERYPEFLPWCIASRIRRREEGVFFADIVIGFKMVRERFASRVEFNADTLEINTSKVEGPFSRMVNNWCFLPHPEGCLVDFRVEFEFRSKFLQTLVTPLFHEAVRRMVGAFEGRARKLYGPATLARRTAGAR